MTSKVTVSSDDRIRRITINRPERRNAVDTETMELLTEEFRRAGADHATRVVVFTGAGESFCAGADLAAMSAEEIAAFDTTAHLRAYMNPLVLQMRSLPVPVIARVDGAAVGAGCNYALASDLIIASTRATFAELFIRIGLMPDGGGTYFLPRLVGYHKAFELMATGDALSADEAHALGIVNRVVGTEELDATVDALARRLAEAPRLALSAMKAGLNHAASSDLAAALDFEAVHQNACLHSPDFLEGVTAFMQKRKP
ncbi:MAG: enoyl-CoA hydratase, partial [Acidobacteriota bacterium]|nr:enoyl-CoA hydratase [Acidobacteriota bacterium]